MDFIEATTTILIKLMENKDLREGDFPSGSSPVDKICAAYKQIYNAVENPEN